MQQKLRLLHDPSFIDLARVAITAGLHSPDLARDMIERLGDREEGIARWIRAAAADGRLDTPDPAFAAAQLETLVKGFAFWPLLAMDQPRWARPGRRPWPRGRWRCYWRGMGRGSVERSSHRSQRRLAVTDKSIRRATVRGIE